MTRFRTAAAAGVVLAALGGAARGDDAAATGAATGYAARGTAVWRLEVAKAELATLRAGENGLNWWQWLPPAPPEGPPAGTRGSVTAYSDGLVVLSIGIDAGLAPGMELDVYRADKFLGSVVVTDVRPKMAVARFKPAGDRRIGQLTPAELPQVGDMAGTFKPGK